jgi:hypothetical protein
MHDTKIIYMQTWQNSIEEKGRVGTIVRGYVQNSLVLREKSDT